MRRRSITALCMLAIGGCGGGSPTPSTLSLTVSGDLSVREAENPKVELRLGLDAPTAQPISAALNFAGSAARGSDYAVDIDVLRLPAGSRTATAEIDIYRDFDKEGDETIEVSLGSITGYASPAAAATVSLTIQDGEAATVDKFADDESFDDDNLAAEPESQLLPLGLGVTEDDVRFTVAAVVPAAVREPVALVAEWSTDPTFTADARSIEACYAPSPDPQIGAQALSSSACEIVPSDDPLDFFLANLRVFQLPLEQLEPQRNYFLRAWLGSAPDPFEIGGQYDNLAVIGFATDAAGQVAVRCVAPERMPTGGGDPLFAEQWHLGNTGQAAFSDRGGQAGADLHMRSTIEAGRDGAGVKVAVIDSGLEICHPDLAASTASGGSFNFAHEARPGTSRTDPFNFMTLGDHGTSVAGIIAATANNGLGGRGVAPGVTLVGFNPLEAIGGEGMDGDDAAEIAMLRSLGGSDRDPDSASVDLFNMSFGYVGVGAENAREEIARALQMGVTQLRQGRGALYVKAAGNFFADCDGAHPFNRELGCIGANSDPDQNIPWPIVVGAFNADGLKSSYSAAGANLWVVGPSDEDDGNASPAMITTDQAGRLAGYSLLPENRLSSDHPLNRDGDYVSGFGGTSSAAPAVAGAVAILLGVNPQLTWRDIKHILASTARKIDPDIAEVRAAFNGTPYIAQHAWQSNAAGFDFHNWYGFGAVDVDAAVEMAETYTPDSLGTFVESAWFAAATATKPLAIPDADGAGLSDTREVAGLPAGARIEAVVLEIAVEHSNTLDLGLTLSSPAGTASLINAPLNSALDGYSDFQDWRLLSNAFYGENPNGTWTLHVADIAAADTGSLTGWRLRFYYGGGS